jgi:hypothetical protein
VRLRSPEKEPLEHRLHHIGSLKGTPKSDIRYMGIYLSCRDAGVAKQALDKPDVNTALKEQCCGRVPKHVGGNGLTYP